MSSRSGLRISLHKAITTSSLCSKLLHGWKHQLSLQQSTTSRNGNPNVMLKVFLNALCPTHVNTKYEESSPAERALNQCTSTHVKSAHAPTHGFTIPMVRDLPTSTFKSYIS